MIANKLIIINIRIINSVKNMIVKVKYRIMKYVITNLLSNKLLMVVLSTIFNLFKTAIVVVWKIV